MAKILMIEDNKDISDANRIMLELEGYEVLAAKDIATGRKLALQENPDLILLDVLLPDGNGVDLCRELKQSKDFNIIFLSALGTKNDVLEGLRAGGYDYMAKPYIMEELLLRIKAMLRNQAVIRNDDFTFGSVTFKSHAYIAECNGKDLFLNPKEYAVLDLLCRNAGQYLSAEVLLEKVWNITDGRAQALYNCLSSLRDKLSETEIEIEFKRGRGYLANKKDKGNVKAGS